MRSERLVNAKKTCCLEYFNYGHTEISYLLEEMQAGGPKDTPNEVQVGPGGDSGAKVVSEWSRRCFWKGFWDDFGVHLGSHNR